MAVKLTLAVPGNIQAFQDALIGDPTRTLRSLLQEQPAYSVGVDLDDAILDTPLARLIIKTSSLHAPPGLAAQPTEIEGDTQTEPVPPPPGHPDAAAEEPAAAPAAPVTPQHPARLTEGQAVAIAYQQEVKKLATFLRSRLSLLVSCEKLVVPHLWPKVIEQTWIPAGDGSNREIKIEPVLLELPADSEAANPLAGGGGGRLAKLRAIIQELKPDQVLVIPNLDLLGGGGEKGLNRESRELTELIYGALDRLVLAFVDPSLPVPEVIAARFAVRLSIEGLHSTVPAAEGGPVPVGTALVTAGEAAMFKGFDPQELFKDIAGLNPVRLREAMAYAVQVARDQGHSHDKPAEVDLLRQELRAFKAQSAEQFTVPNITFDQIGGYEEVKQTLRQAIGLIGGAHRAGAPGQTDERRAALRSISAELVPRGFLFHGPPGTGKTLFAKAIANQLNATVRIVSGPEVTDMYVGESERKVRAIFAEARRNAPAVIVFDEFDSIGARRSGRDDGGGRAGNALVAQILTEMDGFRPEVPLLVIGTTNRLGLIDEALLRPSRFQPIAIGLPDIAARRHIARIHAEHFQIPVEDELLDLIGQATQGLNGDEIRSLFRDACVGHYYKDPPEPADARRLGFLLGRIRTRLDAQQTQGKEQRPPPAPGERRRPSGGMVGVTPPRPAVAPPVNPESEGSNQA